MKPFFLADYTSSEDESEDECEEETVTATAKPQLQGGNEKALISWFAAFLLHWQSLYKVSDQAIQVIVKFIHAFVKVIASNPTLLQSASVEIPSSLHILQNHFNTKNVILHKYTVCPACFTLYESDSCIETDDFGEELPKSCSNIRFPNHPHEARRLACGAPLLKKINLSGGKKQFVPRYEYAYQPIKHSLQKLLYNKGFAEKLEHWRSRISVPETKSDIYDGQVWKDFQSDKYNNFLSQKRSLGVMLNVDFFQPHKHVNESYGVIYLCIVNLPRGERFRQQNVLIVGVIPAFEHEPDNLNPFLKPLVAELQEFWKPGVRLYTAESPNFKVLFRIALMCVACDIPAARKCCGFKGHSANLGCSRCLKVFPGSVGNKNFGGFDRERWPKRKLEEHRSTCAALLKCATTASKETLQTKSGVKYSVLIELPYFDPIRFTIIDPMHSVYLGIAKHVMKKLWLQNGILGLDKMAVIQARVDSFTAPTGVGRIPRKIATSFGGFTAEQWKNWVNLYSMFALRDLLPHEHYVCWQTFVLACFTLSKKAISTVELQKTDLLLLKFCKTVEQLYGTEVITPNMHLCCHLADCINDYGSVYNFWLFSFERYNGILGNYPTNKRHIAVQLMQKFVNETDCSNRQLPGRFKEEFESTFTLLSKPCSEVHQNDGDPSTEQSLTNSTTNTLGNTIFKLPLVHKTTSLGFNDYQNLKAAYSYLYQCSVTDAQMTKSIKTFKSITFYGQFFGSVKNPQSQHSAYIIASWADHSGMINERVGRRPGKVLRYMLHNFKLEDDFKEHIFAEVAWLKEHPEKLHYGKPLEIWSKDFVPDGSAYFLPIHKIFSRCIACKGRLTHYNDENVMFVSPLTEFIYF